MLDVRKMQVLRAVVTSGSVSEAAVNLGYTPSAISQQITSLQRSAGVALLEKAGRGVRATAAGRLLAEHAEEIMAKVAAAESALADLRAGRTGRLRVLFFATVGASVVPPAVAAFRARFPDVKLDLSLTEPNDPLSELIAGRCDMAIATVTRTSPDTTGIRLTHLLDDPYRLVLPRGHRLARKRVIQMSELAEEQWVDGDSRDGPCQQAVLDAYAAAGFSPRVSVATEDYPTAQGFVAAGLGIALIPKLGLGSVHPGLVVRKVTNPEPVRNINVAVRDTLIGQPAAEGLVAALVEATAGL